MRRLYLSKIPLGNFIGFNPSAASDDTGEWWSNPPFKSSTTTRENMNDGIHGSRTTFDFVPQRSAIVFALQVFKNTFDSPKGGREKTCIFDFLSLAICITMLSNSCNCKEWVTRHKCWQRWLAYVTNGSTRTSHWEIRYIVFVRYTTDSKDSICALMSSGFLRNINLSVISVVDDDETFLAYSHFLDYFRSSTFLYPPWLSFI